MTKEDIYHDMLVKCPPVSEHILHKIVDYIWDLLQRLRIEWANRE